MRACQLILLIIICFGCVNSKSEMEEFDIQGHRGCRGLMPENSIPAFLKAVNLGVTTLEMDVVITKDTQVLVSHEPFMNAAFCLDTLGKSITSEEETTFNIYKMDMEQIKKYDCGSKPHSRFPEQEKVRVTKPLLSEVFDEVEGHIKQNNLSLINYNIEVKSEEAWDDIYHPTPQVFSELVYNLIDKKIDWKRITIQSFDFRILRYFHETYPKVQLAILVENNDGIEVNLENLGFRPPIYSCDFELLTQADVQHLHELDVRVIPWTVNNLTDMQRLVGWGVDGLITDYPDRYFRLME